MKFLTNILKLVKKHFSPKTCCVCNKTIIGIYYPFPTGVCCLPCFLKNPMCFYCGLPLKESSPYIFKDDDFLLCSNCNKNNITRKDELKPLHYKMKFYAKEALNIYIPIKKVKLISSNELKKKTQMDDCDYGRTLGYCETSIISCFTTKVINSIYLQNGMPYDLMFKILAHEYGHAWEHQNKREDLIYQQHDLVFTEGFAEWVSYHTIKEYALKEDAEDMVRTAPLDPVNGAGLQQMLKLEKKLGSKHAVLEYVKNHNDF